jgi:streptomycin 6-kinase
VLLAPRVYQWLRDVASQTATPADSTTLITNVRRLQQVPAAPTFVRMAAEKAEHDFLSGKLPPIRVLQHGDLWTGNILKRGPRTGFIIIDWAGARFDGAPFFDLVKFALSVGASRSTMRREIFAHSQLFGCRPPDALAYVLSGLGALYSELEYFPERKFLDLCEQKLHALKAVISG